jgi:hypothetical protein
METHTTPDAGTWTTVAHCPRIDTIMALMPNDSRCRMLLKNGKRCGYRGKYDGLCGHHRRALRKQRKIMEALITTGKVAAAVAAIIKLIEMLLNAYSFFHIHPESIEDLPLQDRPQESVIEASNSRLALYYLTALDMQRTGDFRELPSLVDSIFKELEPSNRSISLDSN